MHILLTGADGYLGWPTFLKLAKAFPERSITAVDNFNRRRWVEEVGALSGVPIASMQERVQALHRTGSNSVRFLEIDLTDLSAVRALLAEIRPDVVIHAAAQPSAPYAERSADCALLTQKNNMAMTLNLLWGLREAGLCNTHYIETTTTGLYGSPAFEIPEGDLAVLGANGRRDVVPYPNMGTSWYHVSKGFNAVNMRLMHLQTKMPVSDVRTSIVYGADTKETRSVQEFANRFDFDFHFGTIFNRWMVMAVLGEPLTIYGSGRQVKPFIHLEDAAQSLVNIVRQGNPNEHRIYNQLTEYLQISDLAMMISEYATERRNPVAVNMVANPRSEMEEARCQYRNDGFMRVLSQKPRMMRDSMGEVIDRLLPHREVLNTYRARLMT